HRHLHALLWRHQLRRRRRIAHIAELTGTDGLRTGVVAHLDRAGGDVHMQPVLRRLTADGRHVAAIVLAIQRAEVRAAYAYRRGRRRVADRFPIALAYQSADCTQTAFEHVQRGAVLLLPVGVIHIARDFHLRFGAHDDFRIVDEFQARISVTV